MTKNIIKHNYLIIVLEYSGKTIETGF